MAFQKAKALQEAEKSVAQGKITQAIKLYQEILRNDPSDVSLLNTVGDLYIRDRNVPEGLRQFHKLAEAYVRDGFNVKAIAIYRKISKVDPNTVDTLLKLAELYQLQGLSREAREQYLHAAEFFKKRNQAEQALDVLRKIVHLDPSNLNYRNRFATECEQMGKREDAAQAYLESAELCLKREDQAAAEAALKKAADLNPKNTKIQILRAKFALSRHQPDEAAQIIASSPELQADPEGKRILLESYIAARRLPEAEKLVLDVFHANPTELGPVASVADQLTDNGQTEEAYELIATVAGTLINQNNAAQLMEPLRRIWSVEPGHIPTMELIHQVCERTADEATLPEVLEALGRAHEQAGDLEKAEAAYLKLSEREPENENYHGLLNAVQRKLGREIKPVDFASKEMALTAADDSPAKPAVVDANQEAMVKEALENSDLFSRYNLTEKAVAELEKVLQIYPDQVDIHQRILEISRKGFPERAVAAAAQLARIFSSRGDQETAAKYDAIASAKGVLHEIPLPALPSVKKAESPSVPPPAASAAPAPPQAPQGEAVMEFAITALPTEEPAIGSEGLPSAEPVPFNLAPPEATVEAPAMPAAPLPTPVTAESLELDLSADLDNMGFEVSAPVEPEPEAAAEIPPPLEVAPPLEPAATIEAAPAEATPELFDLEIVAPPEAPQEPVAGAEETPQFVLPAISEEPAPLVEATAEAPVEEQMTASPTEVPVQAPSEKDAVTVRMEEPLRVEETIPADLDDSKIEIEFYIENGFVDEARRSLAALEERYPDSPLVAQLRKLVDERAGATAQPEAAPAELAAAETTVLVADTDQVISAESVEPPPPVEVEPAKLEPTPLEVPEVPTTAETGEEVAATALEVAVPAEHVQSAEPAQEEWELPTSYAAPQPEPAQESEPVAHPAAATEFTEIAPPPPAAEPAAEHPVAAESSGVDMLGDLAGDFASAMDGMAGAGEAPLGVLDAAAMAPDAPPDANHGAAQLSGLLAEMEEPGSGSSAAKEDPETHYNLGVAFREMGLLDESIGEFQKVVKGSGKGNYPPNFLQACSLLAICFMEKKMPTIAAKWYMRALETPGLDDEATLALEYDLGVAYEQAGDSRSALERFTEVYSQNIDFRDVAEKIRELQQKA